MTIIRTGMLVLVLVLSAFTMILFRYDKSPRGAFYAILSRTPLGRRKSRWVPKLRQRPNSSTGLEEYRRSLYHVPYLLHLETYEGSGQAVHPDVVFIAEGLGAANWRYWMVVTPYPYGQDAFENPCIYACNDGVSWGIPDGLSNPIIVPPVAQDSHYSDPSLLSLDHELWMYYRATCKRDGHEENRLFLTKSRDGIHWNTPVEVLFSTCDGLASPSVVFDGECFMMWTVDSLNWPCTLRRRVSADGMHWDQALEVPTRTLDPGRCPWHIDVASDVGVSRAILVSCTGPGGQGSRLHYCVSADNGDSWVVRPFLLDQVHRFEQGLQYRAALVHVSGIPQLYEVWYSAADKDGTWSVAYLPMVELAGDLHPVSSVDWKTTLMQ